MTDFIAGGHGAVVGRKPAYSPRARGVIEAVAADHASPAEPSGTKRVRPMPTHGRPLHAQAPGLQAPDRH